MEHTLKWMQDDWDENDNPLWRAASFYYYEDSPFYHRIKQVHEGGVIKYALCSDAELMGEDDADCRFESLEEAQLYCQIESDASLKNEPTPA